MNPWILAHAAQFLITSLRGSRDKLGLILDKLATVKFTTKYVMNLSANTACIIYTTLTNKQTNYKLT